LLSHASVMLIPSYIQVREYRVAVAIISRVLRDRVERAREVVGRVEEAHREGRDIAYDYAFATSRATVRRVFSSSASEWRRVVLRVIDLGFELGGSSDPSDVDVVHPCAGGLTPSPPSDSSLAAAAPSSSGDRNHPTGGLDCSVL
jgi:hypothetical protein